MRIRTVDIDLPDRTSRELVMHVRFDIIDLNAPGQTVLAQNVTLTTPIGLVA